MTERTLSGLVLTGGQSRRMGTDKALLELDGESQVARAYRLLSAVCARVYVSVRPDQQNEPERARFPMIVDSHDGLGPVAGILSAQDTHTEDDWLVVACDLPNLSEHTLSYLVEHRDPAAPMVAYRSLVHDGLPEPLCSVYQSGSHAIINEWVGNGVSCPRKMMINSDTQLLDQPEENALDNMNTPDDLNRSDITLRA